MPEAAHLAPTKPESGSDGSLRNNNYATYYTKAPLERTQVAAFVGAYEAPCMSDQAPNLAQYFDSRHEQVQAPSRALHFPNQIFSYLIHVLPTSMEVQDDTESPTGPDAEEPAKVHNLSEELHEQMEADKFQKQLHSLTNLTNISEAEEAVAPLANIACKVLVSSDHAEEIEKQIHDPASLTDDNEDEQTGRPLISDASNNIPKSKPANCKDGATDHLAAGKHWFKGEIVIRSFQNALNDSDCLEAMPRFIGVTRYHIFWTDGSLPNCGRVPGPGGSAAVWKNQGNDTNWNGVWARTPYDTRYPMEAELYAIQLALKEAVNQIVIARRLSPPNTSDEIIILTDSQTALEELKFTMLQAGAPALIGPRQYVAHIINLSEMLQAMGVPIVMRWVPGHSGAYGNEYADRKAKLAARHDRGIARPPDDTEPSVKNRRGFKVSRMRKKPAVSTALTPILPWMKKSPSAGLTPATPISAFDLKVTTINAGKRMYLFSLVKIAPKA